MTPEIIDDRCMIIAKFQLWSATCFFNLNALLGNINQLNMRENIWYNWFNSNNIQIVHISVFFHVRI